MYGAAAGGQTGIRARVGVDLSSTPSAARDGRWVPHGVHRGVTQGVDPGVDWGLIRELLVFHWSSRLPNVGRITRARATLSVARPAPVSESGAVRSYERL